jgi:acyl phosphate:glycerol-3-phosphate acyltransferase
VEYAAAALLVVVAYLMGSIPFAIVVGKWIWHVDVRDHGSGNVGTTNVFRVLGPLAGTLVLIGDMTKGFIPVALARFALHLPPWMTLVVALAALMGHMYSIFLRGGGGKGVATGAGIVLALMPLVFLVTLAVFLVVLLTTRMVSLGSICAALTFALCALVTDQPLSFRILALLATSVVIYAHRDNIRRIARGCENRATFPWNRQGRWRGGGHGRGHGAGRPPAAGGSGTSVGVS